MTSPASRARPDPFAEVRMTALYAIRGANYWSRGPVTCMDIVLGAYDEISSADVPGVAAALQEALPALVEHECSVGERGGFMLRLRRGTYVGHIVEHVALELQAMAGHPVGFGRTRGGERPGDYTVAFEHLHESVGLRAAALALELVQRAFAGTLDHVEHAVAELRAIAATPAATAPRHEVLCGITGGSGATRAELQRELYQRGIGGDAVVVTSVSPASLLYAGLPWHRSAVAIVLDAELTDVPPRFRERDRAERLVGIVVDGVGEGDLLIAPAQATQLVAYARRRGCRVALVGVEAQEPGTSDAALVAWPENGRIHCEGPLGSDDLGPLRTEISASVQIAAALAAAVLEEQPAGGAVR